MTVDGLWFTSKCTKHGNFCTIENIHGCPKCNDERETRTLRINAESDPHWGGKTSKITLEKQVDGGVDISILSPDNYHSSGINLTPQQLVKLLEFLK